MKLCHPNTGIIKKKDKKPKFEPNEILTIDSSYANLSIKVNFIPKLTPKQIIEEGEGKNEIKKTDGEILKERSLVIDAAIVRVMKTCKTLHNTKLQTTVMDQIKLFKVDPVMLRQRINHLMEEKYISKDGFTIKYLP